MILYLPSSPWINCNVTSRAKLYPEKLTIVTNTLPSSFVHCDNSSGVWKKNILLNSYFSPSNFNNNTRWITYNLVNRWFLSVEWCCIVLHSVAKFHEANANAIAWPIWLQSVEWCCIMKKSLQMQWLYIAQNHCIVWLI